METKLKFANWLTIQEMAARRSFARSMGKFEPQAVKKSVAILTAWRGILLDSTGQPYSEAIRRRLNDEENRKVMTNIRRRGLSYYPVVGGGQEKDDQGNLSANKENSLVVQPIGEMDEARFLNHIRELLYNPGGEAGKGPFTHSQWGAMVKLPGEPQAFTLSHPGQKPTGPHDYNAEKPEGDSAAPRELNDRYYTQMKYGPRAKPGMMDPLDQPGDVGNIQGKPGQRFTIKNRRQP